MRIGVRNVDSVGWMDIVHHTFGGNDESALITRFILYTKEPNFVKESYPASFRFSSVHISIMLASLASQRVLLCTRISTRKTYPRTVCQAVCRPGGMAIFRGQGLELVGRMQAVHCVYSDQYIYYA